MSYWDTSALVKLSLEEDDSAEFRAIGFCLRRESVIRSL